MLELELMDNGLVARLQNDYPMFRFAPSDKARWSPAEQKIYYADDNTQTLHELGHAILRHREYRQDIELLQIEREAWNVAMELAPTYGLNIDDNIVEQALDTYRDWLHQRSLCPRCGQTGVQSINTLSYSCPNCQHTWRATAGKNTRLKRLSI